MRLSSRRSSSHPPSNFCVRASLSFLLIDVDVSLRSILHQDDPRGPRMLAALKYARCLLQMLCARIVRCTRTRAHAGKQACTQPIVHIERREDMHAFMETCIHMHFDSHSHNRACAYRNQRTASICIRGITSRLNTAK
eukprot:4878475-Pleurochrysis_carterae.AAC.1